MNNCCDGGKSSAVGEVKLKVYVGHHVGVVGTPELDRFLTDAKLGNCSS